jgi:hypothetical protein
MKKLSALAVAAALITNPAIAAAQDCMTPAEAQALVKVAMPDVIKGVADKCRPSLEPSAFLAQSGTDMVNRYRVSADGAWALAKGSISKLAKDQAALLESLPDEALKPLIGTVIGSEISKGIKPEQCAGFDRAMAALAPLPADNMADLLVAILDLSGGAKAGPAGSFSICKASDARPAPIARPVGTTATK